MMARSTSASLRRPDTVERAKARLQKHDGVRAEVVLEAALDLFSREEYKEVTVQRIADSIGITHSLIYYYYANKEHLFQSALVHALDRVMRDFAQIRADYSDPVEVLSAWFRMNAERADTLKRLVRIMFVNASSKRTSSPEIVSEIIRDFYALEDSILVECIREGAANGIFTCASPEATARFVSRSIDGIYYGALVRKDVSIVEAMGELEEVTWTLLNYDRSGDDRVTPLAVTMSGGNDDV